ncbi:MAG: alpha-hydroxy-acid oxidizing protein [Candidatus Odinarchaeota archaeon]
MSSGENKSLTLEEVRDKARDKLKGICGVYRICDGADNRICQGKSYGAPLGIGGIGSGASFHNNIKALEKIRLKMKLVSQDFDANTNFTFFGKDISMPIMGASVSGVNSFGGDMIITEQDFCHAVVQGCKDAGTIGWRGDTFTYSLETPFGLNAIAKAGGGGVKIVKPREQEVIISFFKKAKEVGATAVGVDVDGCGSYMMAKHNKPVFRKSPEDIKELVAATSLPVIIKGIMCTEDAVAAVEAGASAVVVSDHGGRVMDHTPGTAEVLPGVAEAISGKAMVLVDGGIRTGYDVLKMLGLGADAVLIGRDIVRGAVGGGAEGVRLQMAFLGNTLAKAMKMVDCRTLKDITPDIIINPWDP